MMSTESTQTSPAIRLNIGCADVAREEYLNTDVRSTKVTHIFAHAWDLGKHFTTASVDEIYTRHILEHLDPNEGKLAVASWAKLLKKNGVLQVIVPDLEFHCRQLLGRRPVLLAIRESMPMQVSLGGVMRRERRCSEVGIH